MAPHPTITDEQLRDALSTVQDPEIRRPITELGMVESAAVDADDTVVTVVVLTATLLASVLTTLVITPYLAAVTALVYIDDRMRVEGFDLTLQQAAALARGAPA